MMKTRALAVALIASLSLVAPAPGAAQDPLAQARTLYASADYERALQTLESAPAGREMHYYRALCLIALGREEAAQNQIAAVVALDPMFVPQAGDVSPRVTATFTETRRQLLPGIARATFTDGREKFQSGDREGARVQFERTMKMLADSALDEDDDLADLRLVASGFLDLVTLEPAAAPAPAGPTPAPERAAGAPAPDGAPSEAAAAASEPPVVGGVATVPVTIAQDLPPWRPDTAGARGIFTGAVRVEIDETGRVTAAEMVKPVHPAYDGLVLTAARQWRYKPATLNGVAVAAEKTVEIQLRP